MTRLPRMTLSTVVLECPDAHALANFYRALLGWEIERAEEDWVKLGEPGGGTSLSFQSDESYVRPTWPARPGEQQMMLHLDFLVDDLSEAEAHAVAAGATLAEEQFQDDVRVLIDPAGHPFCVWVIT